MLGEFELIGRYFSGVGRQGEDVLLGVGDDAALLDVGGPEALAICVDTLVAGVHFPENAPPASVGHKALAVNLSDLAAMGARPAWALLALTLPAAHEGWLAAFRDGFAALAQAHAVALVGGDTTRGSLTISITLAGWVPPALALRRDGARPGDGIYVTGTLGDAAAGLRLWQAGRAESSAATLALAERLHRPLPRVAEGLALRGIASAAIDVSDGLVGDLNHVLERSGVGATVEVARLPLSQPLREACSPMEAAAFALSGGDDYELCFTVPPEREPALAGLGFPMTRIGTVEAAAGLRLTGPDGRAFPLVARGFDHFRGGGA